MKASISKKEYHQLLGLEVLAAKHVQSLNEVISAAKEIIDDDESDWTTTNDWAYGSHGTLGLLKMLKVKVRTNGKSVRHNKRSG